MVWCVVLDSNWNASVVRCVMLGGVVQWWIQLTEGGL